MFIANDTGIFKLKRSKHLALDKSDADVDFDIEALQTVRRKRREGFVRFPIDMEHFHFYHRMIGHSLKCNLEDRINFKEIS